MFLEPGQLAAVLGAYSGDQCRIHAHDLPHPSDTRPSLVARMFGGQQAVIAWAGRRCKDGPLSLHSLAYPPRPVSS